jgi:hypothetical protein
MALTMRNDLNALYLECQILSGGFDRQPSWAKVLSHGQKIIPLLIQDLQYEETESSLSYDSPHPWVIFQLLAKLVGANKPKLKNLDDVGRFEAVKQMWLDWAAAQNSR